MVTNGRDLVVIQGAVTKIIYKKNYNKKMLLVRGNPPRSARNTAPVIGRTDMSSAAATVCQPPIE